MRELLIATRSSGKYPEFALALKDLPVTLKSVNDIPELNGFVPEETGASFEENAMLKARAYGLKSNMLTIADDSGLEVDALDGAPGINSARYTEGTDKDRYLKLLHAMKDISDDDRGARFVSVVAVFDPVTAQMRTARGTCEGHIIREPRGERGFGYDPIFLAEAIHKTFAEATLEEKMTIDHRGKALVRAKQILIEQFL